MNEQNIIRLMLLSSKMQLGLQVAEMKMMKYGLQYVTTWVVLVTRGTPRLKRLLLRNPR